MYFRSDEQEREDRRMREVYERSRIKLEIDRLDKSMNLIRGSVLVAVICSLLFFLFAWAALADPEKEVQRRMLPVGIGLAALSAALFSYAVWARSAWRIKRDQINHLLYGYLPEHEAAYRTSGPRSITRGLFLLRPLGAFSGILLLLKVLVLHRITSSATGSEQMSGGAVLTFIAVLLGLWGAAELLDRFSDSLPY